ncbi:hypothetical protein HZA38_01130 [Candidatus Peregrinibacteria bacterium]|nr:hypothetical protein [Candidatus Peregrinibacteria bacterium]
MNDTSVRNKKNTGTMHSSALYLPIAEIKDGVVVLKNGGVRAVLQTSSVNFNLKSEAEQNSLIYAYQGFLNTLEFPIQVLVRSRKLDIDHYLDKLKDIATKQQNHLLQKQTLEYHDYIKKLVEYADIMEKKFFVIVPYDPFRSQNKGIIRKFLDYISPEDSFPKIRERHREFENQKKGLIQRVNVVKVGLENCNLQVEQLSTQQLVELFYQIYNPELSRNQKISEVENYDILPN